MTDYLFAAVIAVTMHLIVTGGLHLDGFIDYIDATAFGKRGGEAVKVLRDPHVGGIGVAALVVLILLKTASLTMTTWATIVLAYVIAVESMFIAARIAPLTKGEGLGKLFVENARRAPLQVNIILYTLTVLVLAFPGGELGKTLVYVAIAGILTPLLVKDITKRIGFVSGDTLGFTYETIHTIILALGRLLR